MLAIANSGTGLIKGVGTFQYQPLFLYDTEVNMLPDYPLHHIGIVVEDLEDTIAKYRESFGLVEEYRENLDDRGVELVFLTLPHTRIELLHSTSPDSKIAKYLENHKPGLHHLCFEVKDIHAELERLKNQGVELIDKEPRKGAHNSLIAFLKPSALNGVLMELCQEQ